MCEPLMVYNGSINQTFMETFAKFVAENHSVKFRQRAISNDARSVPLGWCSWYEFYSNVDEEKVMKNVEFLDSSGDTKDGEVHLPSVDFIQLDDGYQHHIGDWLDYRKDSFPNGLKGMAQAIKKRGYKAGLWLAPFMCGAYSKIARDHGDDWFVKYKPSCKYREDSILSIVFDVFVRWKFSKLFYLFDVYGEKSNANIIGHFNPEWENDLGFIYVLDYTNPEVQAYIKNVFATLKSYGFEYFKIDFLACGIRDGIRYNNDMTRLEIYRMSLQLIRNAVGPDAFILGCGAPLAPSIGLVDGCRISGDIKELWSANAIEYFCSGLFASVPSIKNCLLGNLRRNFVHNIWWLNDPDCVLVRYDKRFNLVETHTQLSLLGMTGGIMLLSDDLSKLEKERIDLVSKILPVSNMLKGSPSSYIESSYPNMFFCEGVAKQLGDADIFAITNWFEGKQTISILKWLKKVVYITMLICHNIFFGTFGAREC